MNHLSPTTFLRYLNCPEQVNLIKIKKVLGDTGGNEDQSMAMATGIAFDILVKCALNRRYKKAELLEEKIIEKNKAAIHVAETIFDHYSRGPLQALREEGIGYGGVDQEVELIWIDPEDGKEYKSILYGQPDLTLTDGTVLDWKVSGAFGSGAQPIDGYIRMFQDGRDMGSSAKSDTGLESIRRDWATQTYLYARLLGHKVGAELRAGIEFIAVARNNQVSCCSYRNPIGAEFQIGTERRFHQAFANLQSQTIEPPHYHPRRCIQYNRLCSVAMHCSAYLKALKENRL